MVSPTYEISATYCLKGMDMSVKLDKPVETNCNNNAETNKASEAIRKAFSESIRTYSDLIHVDGDIRFYARNIVPDLKVTLSSTSKFSIKGSPAYSMMGVSVLVASVIFGAMAFIYLLMNGIGMISGSLSALGFASLMYIWNGGESVQSELGERLALEKDALVTLAPFMCNKERMEGLCTGELLKTRKKTLMALKKGEKPSNGDIIRLAETLFHAHKRFNQEQTIREFDQEFCGNCKEGKE